MSTPYSSEWWKKLVDINQYMWKHRDILREIGWKILVMIHKGNTDTRGIGLFESLWKVEEAIINTCLRASICFHNVLHWTCSSPRCPLCSNSMVCTENQLFIVGIGPIINKELEFIF